MNQSILVADDSATVRTIVSGVLAKAGYCVIEARDGDEAIELLEKNHTDLAILDIVMPGLDGYAVCEKLKSMGHPLCSIPILFLTSVRSNALELMGREFGAYLSKPVQEDQLLAVVNEMLANACQGKS